VTNRLTVVQTLRLLFEATDPAIHRSHSHRGNHPPDHRDSLLDLIVIIVHTLVQQSAIEHPVITFHIQMSVALSITMISIDPRLRTRLSIRNYSRYLVHHHEIALARVRGHLIPNMIHGAVVRPLVRSLVRPLHIDRVLVRILSSMIVSLNFTATLTRLLNRCDETRQKMSLPLSRLLTWAKRL
jgi:hypothetical protein